MKKILFIAMIGISLYANDKASTNLSDELRALLSQEMQFIKSGMDDMLYAIVSNDYKTLGETAKKIQHSYILKQEIKPEQKQEINQKLSTKFMEFDHEFHETAQDLASFAEFEDRENVMKSYSSMINQCVRCHESFATHRFTNFESE
ncbi:cytochrome c [Sulfurimonas marina]|uniref:Cytochrome c n=1 Tax=Sulfurimonas marina TaxID=2590551 RepID=A0A7M1AY53_9BACT|nr:cytochrome c [Sulfurimonas marina]QOP41488.1 hypothetical protein FJR03_06920 [Sulfurimonas marina]